MSCSKGDRQDAGNAVRHRRVHAGRSDRPGPRGPEDDRRPSYDAQLGVGQLPPQAARRRFSANPRHPQAARHPLLLPDRRQRYDGHDPSRGAVLPGARLRADRRGRAEDGRQRPLGHRPHAGLRQCGPLRGALGQAGGRVGPRHAVCRSVRDFSDGGPFGRLASGGGGVGQGGRRRRPAHHSVARAAVRSGPVPGRGEALPRALRLVQHRVRRGRLLRRRPPDQRLDDHRQVCQRGVRRDGRHQRGDDAAPHDQRRVRLAGRVPGVRVAPDVPPPTAPVRATWKKPTPVAAGPWNWPRRADRA